MFLIMKNSLMTAHSGILMIQTKVTDLENPSSKLKTQQESSVNLQDPTFSQECCPKQVKKLKKN